MLRTASDVNSRLPAFKQMVGQIENASHQGAFEGVSPAITEQLGRLVPAGLDSEGRMVLPDSFDAETELPVLLLQTEQETKSRIKIPAEHCRRMADVVFQKLPITVNVSGGWKDRTVNAGTSPHISNIVLPLENESGPMTPVFAPVGMIIPLHDLPPQAMPAVAGHEVDHWDFFRNEAASYHEDGHPTYRREAIEALTEKRAYTTSYRIEQNMGFHALMPSPEDLANQYASRFAKRGGKKLRREFMRIRNETVGWRVPHSLAAMAISHAYGEPTKLLSRREAQAYRAASYS